MKIEIKKVVKAVDLGEYAEEYRGRVLYIWMNPPRSFWREYEALIEENGKHIGQEDHPAWILETFIPGVHGWFSTLWSQSITADTHWTAEEIAQVSEADPAMYEWMQRRSLRELTEFRRAEKKS